MLNLVLHSILIRCTSVSDDFDSYCKTHDLIDESYKNQDKWVSKSIQSVARMGFFTSGEVNYCVGNHLSNLP